VRASIGFIAVAIICLSAIALPCLAQQPDTSTNPKDRDSQFCTIAGTILSANTGEPLKKAQVVIYKDEGDNEPHPQTASSDASGHFSIDHIAAGRYELRVSRVGYLDTQYGQDKPDKPGAVLTLIAGQMMTDLLFRMQRTAVIAGRITDEDGEPVREASVEAFSRSTFRGKTKMEQAAAAITNDLGEYRVFDLPPGSYFILASTPRNGIDNSMQGAIQQGANYSPTYFPGTTEIARASPIEVKSGDEIPGINIGFALIFPGRTYKVHGHVFNSISGHPDANVAVMIVPRGQNNEEGNFDSKNARPDEKTGEFEIEGVPPGEYLVVAVWFEGNKTHTGTQSVDVIGSDIRDVSISLTRGVDISGRLTFEGKSAASASPIVVTLSPSEAETQFSTGVDAKVQPDGSFVLSEVGDGSYSINVFSKCSECYLRSAKANGVDLLDKGVQIDSGNASSSITVVYSSNTANVNGTVTAKDDLPAAGALVVLVPDLATHQKSDHYRSSTTDQYGRFELRGVPPGHYKAFAWEKISEDSYKDPDFLKPFENVAESVDVSENDRKSVQLKLIPASDAAN
jgi:5-hydroxyisourate hydrolase-like protein (transthyretin family)